MGIRKRLEKDRGKLAHKDRSPQKSFPIRPTRKEIHVQKKLLLKAEPDQMKHYLYVSDAKIRNLEQQVAWPAKETPSFQEHLHSLNIVLAHLQKRQQLQSLESGQPLGANTYISGEYLACWGTVNWGMKVCFFFVPTLAGILLMAGSIHHLRSNQNLVEHPLNAELTGASGSDLPDILSAIEFAAEQSGITWSNGISNLSDYLFALALMQGKFFHQMKTKRLSTAFPEQMIEFTDLILKTLYPPSQQQLTDFFVSNALQQYEQEEIERILQKAGKILICASLYVALGNKPSNHILETTLADSSR